MTTIAESNEFGKAICRVLAEIAEREKKKAIQNDDYEDALVATLFKGLFQEAELSFS